MTTKITNGFKVLADDESILVGLNDWDNIPDVLVIPDGITRIERYSFSGLPIRKLIIPDSVTSIGRCAFHACRDLVEVIMGSGVVEIDDEAFEYCTNLESINIPNSCRRIGDYAFYACENLYPVQVSAFTDWNHSYLKVKGVV